MTDVNIMYKVIILNKGSKNNKKYIYILMFAIFLFFGVSAYIANINYGETLQVSNLNVSDQFKKLSVAINQDEYVMQKKEEETDYYTISVYYPLTKYKIVNSKINEVITQYVNTLKSSIDDQAKNLITESGYKYFLDIRFNTYNYLDYITYVSHISTFTGGAHPNSYYYTITYNKDKMELVTIDNLIKKNKSLLVDLSEYTYNSLTNNQKIKDIGALDMVKDGTKPTIENFKNLALTSDGIIIFFENYQVAPYVAGEFAVTVPYDKINLNLN